MQKAKDYYPDCPEVFLVTSARTGDHAAFRELVKRYQSSTRNMMRRFCNDKALADDLSQQVFLKVWTSIPKLKKAIAFKAWLNRLAATVWLQHIRKKDALRNADEYDESDLSISTTTGIKMDLDLALAKLSEPERLCIVLSYNAGMSHSEIVELTKFPLGTVKSHINRGAKQLRQILSAYEKSSDEEQSK